MSIVRRIRHTFNSAMAIPQMIVSIYINEKPIFYQIEIYLSLAKVSLSPKVLDFDDIDVGTASEQLSVQLTNSGHKSAQFVVDLGIIQPFNSVEIKVELLGIRAGIFIKEFWIKNSSNSKSTFVGNIHRTSVRNSPSIRNLQIDFSSFSQDLLWG